MELSYEYIAGLIDGEGTITLARKHKKDKWRTPVISVSSTTLEIIHALKATLGGHVCAHKKYQEHHKAAFSWRLTGRKAIALCGKLKDSLRVPEKRHRANLIFQAYLECTPRNGKYTTHKHAQKVKFETTFFNTAS